MAEKEERILILTGNKDNYPAWNYSRGPLYLDEDYYDGISRTEAIERMAKAVCMRSMYGCERCAFGKDKEKCKEWIAFNHIGDAEAALNALLEGK